MSEVIEYFVSMRAERTADIYCGENCDEHRPLWRTSCDGDRGESEDSDNIVLSPQAFPPGTKITISLPVCPECHTDSECCQSSHCSFDWKEWTENMYS
jgi:hypothetical protein